MNTKILYCTWVVLAIQGLMRDADQLLKQYQEEIYLEALKLSRKFPVRPKPVYRGILLEPKDNGNENYVYHVDYGVKFISFTQNLEVACWFASTDSYMAHMVMLQKPKSAGFIIEHTPEPEDILFDWKWHKDIGFKKFRPMIEKQLLLNHIYTDLDQYVHNVVTQKEIILKPLKIEFNLTKKEDRCSKSGRELDKIYLPDNVIAQLD